MVSRAAGQETVACVVNLADDSYGRAGANGVDVVTLRGSNGNRVMTWTLEIGKSDSSGPRKSIFHMLKDGGCRERE